MKVFVLVAILLPLATAHLCLLSPQQRGNMMQINTPGADDCYLTKDKCGGRDHAEPARTTLWAGIKNTVVFQKNLDHYNMKMPGSFRVNLWVGDNIKPTMLGSVKDSNTTSLYLYEMMVDVPMMEAPKAVLQVIYTTSNPDAPANFYQCADVKVMKPPGF